MEKIIIKKMERVTGIEPAYSAWKADVLPLNYTRALKLTLSPKSSALVKI